MARRGRSRTDLEQMRARGEVTAGGQPLVRADDASRALNGALHPTELLSLVCAYFAKGHNASEIRHLLARDHGIEVNREVPYQSVAFAAAQGWIQFAPPPEHALGEDIRGAYGWLHEAKVLETVVAEHVSRAGARQLLQLLQQHHADKEVHVGFSGGHAMRELARALSELLRRPARNLPSKIVFHAMVVGFDVYDPTTDPNAFFTYFVKDPALQVETAFVGLHTPAVVKAQQFAELRKLDGVHESFDHARELDVIVTSARDWFDEHSTLQMYLRKQPGALEEYKRHGAVGDFLWLPLGPQGQIVLRDTPRAMTLMELEDVARFVKSGKRVLLVAGPCTDCLAPKTGIVRTVLEQAEPLITHLMVDSRCARELLKPSRTR